MDDHGEGAEGAWQRKELDTSCNLAHQEIAYCVQYSAGKKSLQFVEHFKNGCSQQLTAEVEVEISSFFYIPCSQDPNKKPKLKELFL